MIKKRLIERYARLFNEIFLCEWAFCYDEVKNKGECGMKNILISIILGMHSMSGMYVLNSPFNSIARQHNQKFAFNDTHAAFGKTHFIVGYRQPQKNARVAVRHDGKKYGAQKVKTKTASSLLDCERMVQPFFTSTHCVRSVLAELIDQAETSILIAAFTLTDPDIMQRLQKAHTSGIVVEIITDQANMHERYSKTKNLAQMNIPVYYYKAELNPNPQQKNSRFARMHHKFLIIDKKIGVTGSTNYTKTGQKDSIENIMVFRDKNAVDDYVQEFEHLKKLCGKCTNHE
jgi:phosphatidylserine/phosphatidylglycerophosphate/cardiolipin synthase-like enzyme